ncbi:hypothetical protein H6F74_28575 [Trichocoleus sp. FACHB-90]|uniref:hypothetical protein n=1 Tax=Cyanophyceae TaxID=3028117 RepID=UPI0016864140|nr:hypothetical protein [Trichocoleus sp. FACHB-90]MBD1930146.1 hypothetical protein [Trichocoleus sp. FACHB-90]
MAKASISFTPGSGDIHAIARRHFSGGIINFPYFGDWYKPWAELVRLESCIIIQAFSLPLMTASLYLPLLAWRAESEG